MKLNQEKKYKLKQFKNLKIKLQLKCYNKSQSFRLVLF